MMGIRITYSKSIGSGYISFRDIKAGESKKQVVLPNGLIFDLDENGQVLGAEFLNAEFTKGLDCPGVLKNLQAQGICVSETD